MQESYADYIYRTNYRHNLSLGMSHSEALTKALLDTREFLKEHADDLCN